MRKTPSAPVPKSVTELREIPKTKKKVIFQTSACCLETFSKKFGFTSGFRSFP
eukprot:TRINITY_DN2302_c0_g1_i1.p2 TRINITY_DN2302_c0_g1~~TRINITY_DN2302_c0_g1_i1.p2  ORF type:complete len:53 (+),score=7.38 TRINITY_DN2302_c0_g1_i1:439-597(+)